MPLSLAGARSGTYSPVMAWAKGRLQRWARFGSISVVLVAACSSSTGENSQPDPPQTFVQLTLEISGGYGPEPCSNGGDHYEVATEGSLLSWTGCDYSKTPSEPISGERALTESELQSVNDAFHGIALSTAKTCGADAAVLTLDVKTNQGVEHYVDDFYSGCPWQTHDGRTFVTGLNNLGAVLRELSQKQ